MQKGQQDPLGLGRHSWKDGEAVGRDASSHIGEGTRRQLKMSFPKTCIFFPSETRNEEIPKRRVYVG